MQMFTKEQVEGMKAKELMKLATSLGVKGAWDMRKAEVITAILSTNNNEVNDDNVSTNANADQNKLVNNNRMRYVENVEIGTIVAFTKPDGGVDSAKVINRSTSKRKLKVQTYYGIEYVIAFEDVIWVKTGSRWPKGVYNLLKGRSGEVKNA